MHIRTITALLMALLMAVSACAGALAQDDDDFEYEGGDPPFSPEFMLRANPAGNHAWSHAFAKGGVAELITDYKDMAAWRQTDSRGAYQGEGGYAWARLDGLAQGMDTLTLTYDDEHAPINRLTVSFFVDDDLDVTLLAVGTDDAPLPEAAARHETHPVLLLAAHPVSGQEWVPDNSYTPGLRRDDEYLPMPGGEGQAAEAPYMAIVTLVGEGDDTAPATFSYARPWESDSPFLALYVSAACDDTDVTITALQVAW